MDFENMARQAKQVGIKKFRVFEFELEDDMTAQTFELTNPKIEQPKPKVKKYNHRNEAVKFFTQNPKFVGSAAQAADQLGITDRVDRANFSSMVTTLGNEPNGVLKKIRKGTYCLNTDNKRP